MISESEVPRSSIRPPAGSFQSSTALVRLPLWASALPTHRRARRAGRSPRRRRRWSSSARARSPCRRRVRAGSPRRTPARRARALRVVMCPPSRVAVPADSWPRCWARRARSRSGARHRVRARTRRRPRIHRAGLRDPEGRTIAGRSRNEEVSQPLEIGCVGRNSAHIRRVATAMDQAERRTPRRLRGFARGSPTEPGRSQAVQSRASPQCTRGDRHARTNTKRPSSGRISVTAAPSPAIAIETAIPGWKPSSSAAELPAAAADPDVPASITAVAAASPAAPPSWNGVDEPGGQSLLVVTHIRGRRDGERTEGEREPGPERMKVGSIAVR